MTNDLGNIVADFSTTLNLKVAVGATSATLDSATDDDGVALPTGTYFLTIDDNNSSKEYIKCTLTSTALTSIQSLSRQGALTTGFARTHRKGAVVKMTDFGILLSIIDAIDGTTPASITLADLAFSGTTTTGLKVKSLTTTQRDAATNIANGNIIYNTTEGEFQIYQGGAWSTMASGSTQPDASATVAGKVEIATSAQSIAGTDTGETGASLVVLPSDIKTNLFTATQAQASVFGVDAGGDDTYVVALAPVLTAYTVGQTLSAKLTTTNTGACTIDFGPGVLNIKMMDGTDPLNSDIIAGGIYNFKYDGTNAVLQQVTTRATDAEALAGTNQVKYISPAQLEAHSLMNAGVISDFVGQTNGSTDTTVTLTFQPRIIKLNYWLQGHDSSASTNSFFGSGGTAVYEGTTLKFNNANSVNLKLAGDNGGFDTTFSNVNTILKNSNLVAAPYAGTSGENAAEKHITLLVLSVSATGFVIRTTVAGGGGNNARAAISWEAYQ